MSRVWSLSLFLMLPIYLALTGLASAQSPGREFFMLLRTSHDTEADDVKILMDAALSDPTVKAAGVKGKIQRPAPAQPEVYYQMLSWIEDITTARAPQGGPLQISRFAEKSTEWDLNLGIPDNSLLDLTVTVETPRGSGNSKDLSFKPDPASGLRFNSQGRYSVSLPADCHPKKYKAKVREGMTGLIKDVAGDWPISDAFFFVRVSEFQGDERVLYKALRDGAAGQKVQQIHEAKAIEIVLADFLPTVGRSGILWQQNRMVIREPMPDGVAKVRRVWMQFPISEVDAQKRWSELSKLKRNEVSAKIRSEKTVFQEGAAPASLAPSYTDPAWYELPPIKDNQGNVTHFERTFVFEDVPKWKEITKGINSAWRLVVYEFDNGEQQYALSVTHPTRPTNTFVVDQEIPEWAIGVNERLKEGGANP